MTEPITPPNSDAMLPLIRLFEGDSLDVLATIADGTYTGFVTDPPYGLSAAPDPVDVLTQWLLQGDFVRGKGGRTKAPPPGLSEIAARFARTAGPGGFLGAKWDSFVPGPRLWREVFRACKPGAIGLVFASPRTQHWMALALVLAGFEVIDTIGWITAQGMAKSGTVDKRIDARNGDERPVIGKHPNPGSTNKRIAMGDGWQESPDLTSPGSPVAAEWQGYSTQLAPGIEPIIVVRRPCEGTAVQNVLTHGCGAMNIDACRIPREEGVQDSWPKNAMFDAAAAAILDDMVGDRTSGSRRAGARKGMGYHGADGDGGPAIKASRGGPSRFFWVGPLATDDDCALPVRYVPKASKADRAEGLPPGVKGDHPTKKPPKLVEWMCRLVGHLKGRLLDPFAGSGTTLRAARKMGLPCDGIERDHHYCIDLAAPCAGIDSADVIRVDPPATPTPPSPAEQVFGVPVVPVAPTHVLSSLDRDVVRSVPTVTIVGPRQMSAPVFIIDAQVLPTLTLTPALEIPVPPRLVVDDFVSVPPMFPRLPGAPEYP